MNWVAEQLIRNANLNPDHPIFCDEATGNSITNRQLLEQSGRIAAHLRESGIGREDFVLVKLPRGTQPFVAALGVWRAGAACVLVEADYAPDRIAFIRKDCAAKHVLDTDDWAVALSCEPMDGFVDVDDHDAAYAVYTSGTTGNPKGVLHEYGNLPEAPASLTCDGSPILSDDERIALNAPINFVASNIILLAVLASPARQMHVVSYLTLKNPALLRAYFDRARITLTFLTPSYVRRFGCRPGRFIERLVLSSEPANGVIPDPAVTIFNVHAMSETGCLTASYRLTETLANCPIGKPPRPESPLLILDEDGREAPDGATGELCFATPFVRGYVNLPDENARAFRDGLFHSGDLARKLPSGDFVLLGRNSDMVKINGNRVEPMEVEAAVRDVLGLDWCAVRGFEDDKQAFLAAYFTADVRIDPTEARRKLSVRLPYYMLPQYFIRIDKIPLNANGKFTRKALPRPDTSAYRTDYVEPADDVERTLCAAMASTLKVSRVGATDDFYELGGDSLGSMNVVVASKLRGLDASDVFRGRTARGIAALYREKSGAGESRSPDELNAAALAVPHPLTDAQLYMLNYQLYTPMSTMYNLFGLFRVDKDRIDFQRFANALATVLRHHPVFRTALSFNADGDPVQSYCADFDAYIESHVFRVSEFDVRIYRDDMVKPFKLMGAPLFRYVTDETEKAYYFFFDMHHIIADGTSVQIFFRDLVRAYAGQPLEPDYYYLLLDRQRKAELSPFYEESRKYFESTFGGDDWTFAPRPDHDSRENALGHLNRSLDVALPALRELEQRTSLSRNAFLLTAFGLAFAIDQDARNVRFTWIYNGRDNELAMNACGLLFRTLPTAFRFRDDQDVSEIYAGAREQVRQSIEHSVYPYCAKNQRVVLRDTPCVLYQGALRSLSALGELGFMPVEIRQNMAASQSLMDLEIVDTENGLDCEVDYASSRYERTTMERLTDRFIRTCRLLVEHGARGPLTFAEIRRQILET